MAEGVLILLIGEENKQRETYLSLDKEYRFQMLIGVAFDTYDLLGIPTVDSAAGTLDSRALSAQILRLLPQLMGRSRQTYPPFSAKQVKGKPLWWWAREKRLGEIDLPTKEVAVTDLSMIGGSELTLEALHTYIVQTVAKVVGDFRQEEILARWSNLLFNRKKLALPLVELRVTGSTGLYIRQLVQTIGKIIGWPTVVYRIVRVRVGDF
jgi:tRNA pseudouridine(55) synthase